MLSGARLGAAARAGAVGLARGSAGAAARPALRAKSAAAFSASSSSSSSSPSASLSLSHELDEVKPGKMLSRSEVEAIERLKADHHVLLKRFTMIRSEVELLTDQLAKAEADKAEAKKERAEARAEAK